ncbi:RasGAP-domain-containing protein [Cylindrobasidium torrendii FP15055 ss-10]|uniref:RasGAP-domain-containing protein n=1 Tax=Cylindrobasidium torrendii FP15055 ss-10 TaxID=1314674 RepID=A0A0D7AQC7_9AGAR|nr:RasGAP-domain-containing protein [Cylindrobasidium torrendii FP15055 ss-10]
MNEEGWFSGYVHLGALRRRMFLSCGHYHDRHCSIVRLQQKYPDATDYAICSLIGGFFFLQFINPAIVTLQAYMLIEGVPANVPRRTLTLIAKMLQNLANKPSYSKEIYMMSLYAFADGNKV